MMRQFETFFREAKKKQKGAILFLVAASLVVLIGFLGLAFDLGHMYVNKSQLQNMADACALAGATALNGTSAGIDLATSRARDAGGHLNNKTEFNNQSVTLAASDISFSTALNGTYVDMATAEGIAANIRYVRAVIPPQQSQIFFAKLIPGIPASLNFGAEAVAGQYPQVQVCNNLDPFTPSVINASDPTGNFGYQIGSFYSLRLAPGNSWLTCTDLGYTNSATGNFGFADVGGCGMSTPCLRDSIINGSRNNCIGVGPTLPAITGDRGVNIPRALQDRFDQDNVTTSPLDYNTYITQTTNYRRILRVAFNDGNIPSGTSTDYTVSGFGCFYMVNRPSNGGPGSRGLCAQYVGACDQNGVPTGSGGASITQLVIYR